MGQRASDTRVIHFDNVRVPAARAARRRRARASRSRCRRSTARGRRSARSRPASRAARSTRSIAYAKERKAFGFPIGGFQAVQFLLADMAKDIEAGRAADAPERVDGRPGPARVEVLVVRQVLRDRRRDARHDRRGPDLRRQRLHEGVPGREADARRKADADLRGHQPDPAPGDRPRAARRSRSAQPKLSDFPTRITYLDGRLGRSDRLRALSNEPSGGNAVAITREQALAYHASGRPGKIKVVPTKPTLTADDLSLAYTPRSRRALPRDRQGSRRRLPLHGQGQPRRA